MVCAPWRCRRTPAKPKHPKRVSFNNLVFWGMRPTDNHYMGANPPKPEQTPNIRQNDRYRKLIKNLSKTNQRFGFCSGFRFVLQRNTLYIYTQLDEHCITLIDNRLPSSRTVRDYRRRPQRDERTPRASSDRIRFHRVRTANPTARGASRLHRLLGTS